MKNKPSIDTKDQPTCLCTDPIFWNESCPAHPVKPTPTALSSTDDKLHTILSRMYYRGKDGLGWSVPEEKEDIAQINAVYEAHIAEHYVPKARVKELDEILNPLWWSDETHLAEAKQQISALIQDAATRAEIQLLKDTADGFESVLTQEFAKGGNATIKALRKMAAHKEAELKAQLSKEQK